MYLIEAGSSSWEDCTNTQEVLLLWSSGIISPQAGMLMTPYLCFYSLVDFLLGAERESTWHAAPVPPSLLVDASQFSPLEQSEVVSVRFHLNSSDVTLKRLDCRKSIQSAEVDVSC